MRPHRLGIVSDTHGETLPDVVDVLKSAAVDLILHAGDIGAETVLSALEEIAPVVAVAGNGDESLYHRYPWNLRLHFGKRRIFLCHWYNNFGRIHPAYEQVVREWEPHALVYGHTHEAMVERWGETLFVNPGYAGPPEPARERSVATLELATLRACIHWLQD